MLNNLNTVSMSKTKSSKTAKATKTVAATVTVSTPAKSTRTGMRYAKLSQSEKLSIIASRKRRGDNQMIATRFGMDSKVVSAIVTGRKSNTRVVNAMYNQVRGRKVNAKVGA